MGEMGGWAKKNKYPHEMDMTINFDSSGRAMREPAGSSLSRCFELISCALCSSESRNSSTVGRA
jgi:hypothetical protein